MMPRSGYRIALTFIVAVLALSFALTACGGSSGGKERPTPASDEEAILFVLQDYAQLRADGDSSKLAELFSPGHCPSRVNQAKSIITNWDLVSEDFSLRVDSVTVETMEADHAMVLPLGALLEQGNETSGGIASQPIEMWREEGAWKIGTCGLVLPYAPFSLP